MMALSMSSTAAAAMNALAKIKTPATMMTMMMTMRRLGRIRQLQSIDCRPQSCSVLFRVQSNNRPCLTVFRSTIVRHFHTIHERFEQLPDLRLCQRAIVNKTRQQQARRMSIVIRSTCPGSGNGSGHDGSKDDDEKKDQSKKPVPVDACPSADGLPASSTELAAEEIVKQQLKLAKRSLRREIDARLATLTLDEVNRQSAKVHQRLFGSDVFRNASRIGMYLSLPAGEIHTQPILQRCFDDGKQVFVPSYDFRTRQMEFYRIRSMSEYESLPIEPKYKIKQPELENTSGRDEALSTGGLDILLCPGVCFTKDGKRLGHGRGYFDTWLKRMSQTENIIRPTLIALALEQQIVDDLPVHEWDFLMDTILSPNEF